MLLLQRNAKAINDSLATEEAKGAQGHDITKILIITRRAILTAFLCSYLPYIINHCECVGYSDDLTTECVGYFRWLDDRMCWLFQMTWRQNVWAISDDLTTECVGYFRWLDDRMCGLLQMTWRQNVLAISDDLTTEWLPDYQLSHNSVALNEGQGYSYWH